MRLTVACEVLGVFGRCFTPTEALVFTVIVLAVVGLAGKFVMSWFTGLVMGFAARNAIWILAATVGGAVLEVVIPGGWRGLLEKAVEWGTTVLIGGLA